MVHKISGTYLSPPLWKVKSPIQAQPGNGSSDVNHYSSNCFMNLPVGMTGVLCPSKDMVQMCRAGEDEAHGLSAAAAKIVMGIWGKSCLLPNPTAHGLTLLILLCLARDKTSTSLMPTKGYKLPTCQARNNMWHAEFQARSNCELLSSLSKDT